MAQAKTDSSTYDRLAESLAACQTVTELFKLASSDAFRSDSAKLEPLALDDLRGVYKTRQQVLDGRVRLGEFDGQVIRIVDIDYWHSDRFEDESAGKSGDGVTLTFHPESDLGKRFKAVTSSAVIVRFCNSLSSVPTETEPLRVQVKQVPVNDAERAARGQKMWTIKRLPMGEQRAASPF